MASSAWKRVTVKDPCPVCAGSKGCAFYLVETEIKYLDKVTGELVGSGKWEPAGWVKCIRCGPGASQSNWSFVHEIGADRNFGVSYKWAPPGHAVRSDLTPAQLAQARDRYQKQQQQLADAKTKRNAARQRLANMTWGQAETQTYIDVEEVRERARVDFVPASMLAPGGKVILEYLKGRGIDLYACGLPRTLRYHGACTDTHETRHAAMLGKMVVPVQPGRFDVALKTVQCVYLTNDTPPTKRSQDAGPRERKLSSNQGAAVRLAEFYELGVLLLGEGIETTLAAWLALHESGMTVAAWSCIDRAGLENFELPYELAGHPCEGDQPVPADKRGVLHTIIIAADLDASGDGQASAIAAARKIMASRPWITVEVVIPHSREMPDLVQCVGDEQTLGPVLSQQPSRGKGVDWNDVVKSKGVGAAGAALRAWIDVPASRERWMSWRPSFAWGSRTVRPVSTNANGQDGLTASSVARAVQGVEQPVEGEGGGKPPSLPPNRKQRSLPRDPLERARRFLLEEFSPPAGDRGDSAFFLRRWSSRWYEYNGRGFDDLKEEHLFARVQHWLSNQVEWDQELKDVVPVGTSPHSVKQLIESLVTDCGAEVESMPAWVPPSFDSDGNPRWGTAVVGRRHAVQMPDASNIIAFRNVLLYADKWAKGEAMETIDHHPTWFSGTTLPYDLPIEDIQTAASMGDADGTELCKRLCPKWLDFLEDVSNGSAAWIKTLQQWFGYTLVASQVMEKILLITGPKRSGKGTIEQAWRSMLGKNNVVASSLDDVCDMWSLLNYIGKPLAIMSDVQLGKFTDPGKAVERLKSISGQGLISVRRMHKDEMITTTLPTKFVITCNDVPNLMDSSTALAGRLIILPMTKSYFGREKSSLKEGIPLEAAGIMVWALYGLADLWSQLAAGKGFTLSPESLQAQEDFQTSSSPLSAFAKEHIEIKAGEEVDVNRMHNLYLWWHQQARFTNKPYDKQRLGKLLRSIYPQIETSPRSITDVDPVQLSKKQRRWNVFVNVVLRNEPDGVDLSVAPDLLRPAKHRVCESAGDLLTKGDASA
jgi:P4 family phage/plasmid primase-like protien